MSPTLANIFLCHYEDIWLRNRSLECKPSKQKRYVDDIFVLFESEIQVEPFKDFMNTCHPKLKFTFGKEQNSCFNFLDVKVIRQDNVFTTSVYRKPSFTGVYKHFDSYMLLSYKFSLVSTIIFCSLTICSGMPKFHQEIFKIKDIFIKNVYSERFLDKCVKTFLNKVFIPKRIIQTAEKKQVTIALPYMGMISTELKVKLHKTFKQLLPACDLRVIFKVSLRMKNYFNFKDKIKRELRSLLVYNFKCNSCNAEYIGKTKRHYRTRTSEHIGVSSLTGKYVKNNPQTLAIHDHMLFCKTVVCPEDISILANSSCNFKLEIQESILIKLLKPTLNKNIS